MELERNIKDFMTRFYVSYLDYKTTKELQKLNYIPKLTPDNYWVSVENNNGEIEEVFMSKDELISKLSSSDIAPVEIIPAVRVEDAGDYIRREYQVFVHACPLVNVYKEGTPEHPAGMYMNEHAFIWKINQFIEGKLESMQVSNSPANGCMTYCTYMEAYIAGVEEAIRQMIQTICVYIGNNPNDDLPF